MGDWVRIGKVNSIDETNGMVKILYTDPEEKVSASWFPFLANGEYRMPKMGEMVITIHPGGTEKGICVGTVWNKGNVPGLTKENFRKIMTDGCNTSATPNDITFTIPDGSISVSDLLQMKADIEMLKGFH